VFLRHRVRWTAFFRFDVPRNPTQSFVGDLHYCQGLVHIDAVQFDNPSVCIKFDSDPEKAAEQRKRTFADAAKNRYLLAFAHVSFPGVGRVRKEGHHYRWIPVEYMNDALKDDALKEPQQSQGESDMQTNEKFSNH